MNRIILTEVALILVLCLCSCVKAEEGQTSVSTSTSSVETSETTVMESMTAEATVITCEVNETKECVPEGKEEMLLKINGTAVDVLWEENETVEALRELVKGNSLTIKMSMYGGFEQVGPIGSSLPHKDKKKKTASGDIVLYSGNQIVIFYGSNTWEYTRLGKVKGLSSTEMKKLLGNGAVTLTITIE